MTNPDHLIDKTDALLSRYRGAVNTNPDVDFPVLTEIYFPAATRSAITNTVADAVVPDSDRHLFTDRPAMEDRIVQSVLKNLAPHIDAALGAPLKERLDEHLRRVLSALTGQVRIDIETLVRIAVTQAVDQALSEHGDDSLPLSVNSSTSTHHS